MGPDEDTSSSAPLRDASSRPDSYKDHPSLKRTREGSTEPSAAESPAVTPVQVKKNRLASQSTPPPLASHPENPSPTSSDEVDADDHTRDDIAEKPLLASEKLSASVHSSEGELDGQSAEKETKNVGEVRKQVQRMATEDSKIPGASSEDAMQEDAEAWEQINEDEVEDAKAEEEKDTLAKGKRRPEDEAGQGEEADGDTGKKVKKASIDEVRRTVEEANGESDIAPAASESEKPAPPLAKKPQPTFGSFASSSSPFASLKPSAESPLPAPVPTAKPSPTPLSAAAAEFVPRAPVPAIKESQPAAEPVKKTQSTFASFTSVSSPFSAVKSSSPFAAASVSTSPFGAAAVANKTAFSGSAFGSYSSTPSGFGSKAAQDVEEAGPSSFGDKLKETTADDGEEEVKVYMTEQHVATGEEEEDVVFSTRAKLFVQLDGQWRERGVGPLKVLVRQVDGRGARLVMRADGSHRLILNCPLYVGMTVMEDGKLLRASVMIEGAIRPITLRVNTAKTVDELSQAIHNHIPLESAHASRSPEPVASAA